MECPFCAEQIPSDAEDCPECGRPLDPQGETLWDDGGDGATQLFTPPPESAEKSEPPAERESPAGGWSMPAQAAAATPLAATSLEPGRMLGQRYEIEKMLGEGGMGAVYKAKDVELDRAVALKVIRPELATDPEILQRFKQEIILAREVTHRNVIRIFDLGQADGIKFISMEFVEGQDLHEILKEKGSLPVEEAVEIMEQVCMALGEAHEEGVVHRDLKPHNIMIDRQGRVVVMDFGIARSVQTTGMTQTGSVLGTPDYMSPEQVKGQHVDSRSDLFALGVIFFQLLSGEVPYEGDSPMAAMYTRTQDRAKSVREVNSDVPGFLASVIARCLEISPQKRYQSARELLQDLELWRGGTPRGMTVGMRHITTVARSTQRRTWMRIGALVLAVALVFAVVQIVSRLQPEEVVEATVAAEDVTSLAILPFSNASGAEDVAWLSTGLADMLLTDVGQSAYLRTVSPDRLHQILRDLGMTQRGDLDAAERRRIAEYANADKLIWGQFIKLADQIRIDATVEDVAQQIRTPVKVEAANEGELLESVGRLAGLVRDNLELSSDRVEELEERALKPSSDSVVALRHYLQGLELIRQGNNLDAVAQFEASVIEDPEFALAHSKLGEANLFIGHGQVAREQSARAVELSEDLPAQERHLILAADSRITGNLEQGTEAFENLLRYRPNDPDLHYELGALYEGEGLFDQADEHYSKTLEADPQNISALLAKGRTLALRGDDQSALETLNTTLELAVQVENREAEANVLHSMGLAYANLDRSAEALEKFEQSFAIKRELGDQRGMASSLGEIAYLQDLAGDFEQARQNYEETIRLREAIGDHKGVGVALMNLGDMERILGNYEEALDLTRRALRIQVEMNDEFNQGLALNNIGAIYYLQGKYDDAFVFYQRALEIRERLELPTETADTLHNIGETYQITGLFDRALGNYLRALELRRSAEDERGAALESYYIGKVFAAQGRFGAALESITESADTFAELGDRSSWFAESKAWQGHLLSLLGAGEEAEALLAEASTLAEESQDPWVLSLVLNFEGDRSYYLGDYQAAQSTFRKAAEAAGESGDPLRELTSKINVAKVDIALNRSRQAITALEQACAKADGLGLRVLERRCVLHLGIAQLAAGNMAGINTLTSALAEGDELTPKDLGAVAHHQLALGLREQGQDEAAGEHEQAALALLEELRDESGRDSLVERADLSSITDTAG